MELSLPMKLRIAAALLTGAFFIGFLAWPLAAPDDLFGIVSLSAGNLSLGSAIILVLLALFVGLLAYFICWPYGREIGVLAVPAGLAVWAVRSGSIANVIQQNPTVTQRLSLFAELKWEPIFWLAIVIAGFGGVLLGEKISSKRPISEQKRENPDTKSPKYLYLSLAFVASGLIAQFCIKILARDVNIGPFVAQPAVGQIIFAVLVSFAVSAFIVKKFLNAGYLWPTLASAFVTAFAISLYVKQNVIEQLVRNLPAVFSPHAITSILPIQMVTFGTLGSIIGYWLAVRYDYWRKHELK